ncbi:hypothetical protein CLU97_0034 [Chryseobacterium sp. 7]|uniref:hypothetical protein n=1 Tax=Chryseobacterium sp. 7 TaxID=2035214 RepID=UPI000EB00621|nr:hypothetical protein [Chryseobacterium sp. 7]RLJ30664.1 hypothetical protein CLU97_0034 [Chryseobacterium sp. 7]
MNYSGLITKFWQYNKKEPVGAITASIYLFLLETWKENEENEFKLSDIEICRYLKITRPTINALRQKLGTLGMIRYQSKNGVPCHYKILLEYSPSISNTEKTKEINLKKKKDIKKEPCKTFQNQNISPDQPVKISSSHNQLTDAVPSLEMFVEYVKTLENYGPELDILIKEKYSSWHANGWKNGYEKPITNWKSSIKNTIPFLQNELQSSNDGVQILTLPAIKHPKSNLDE